MAPARRSAAEGGPGIAEEKVSLAHREIAATAMDAIGIPAKRFNLDAQCLQGFQHAGRIVGGEQIADFRRAYGQRRQQQHDWKCFRAGQADGAARRNSGGRSEIPSGLPAVFVLFL